MESRSLNRVTYTIFLLLFSTHSFGFDLNLQLPETSETKVNSEQPVSPKKLQGALALVNSFLDQISARDPLPGWNSVFHRHKEFQKEKDWRRFYKLLYLKMGNRTKGYFEKAITTNILPNGRSGRFVSVTLTVKYEKGTLSETITVEEELGVWHFVSFKYKKKSKEETKPGG